MYVSSYRLWVLFRFLDKFRFKVFFELFNCTFYFVLILLYSFLTSWFIWLATSFLDRACFFSIKFLVLSLNLREWFFILPVWRIFWHKIVFELLYCEKRLTFAQCSSRYVVQFPSLLSNLLFHRILISFVVAQSCVLSFI